MHDLHSKPCTVIYICDIVGIFGEVFDLAPLQKITKFKTAKYCYVVLCVCDQYQLLIVSISISCELQVFHNLAIN